MITIIGTGYVGLVTGACFAEIGNRVTCVDIDAEKIGNLRNGIMPIFEPGLEEMVTRNVSDGNLFFTTSIEDALAGARVCFISVGTPMNDMGGADLSFVYQAARDIGRYMARDILVVNKSTVPVGTADEVREIIETELKARGADHSFKVVSNPEFLKEGAAIKDCMSPDRIVIGAPDNNSANALKELYAPFIRNSDRFMIMDVKSAEMTKYAANAMLATRISFMNEMANICEVVGADVNSVRLGIGSDSRIGYSFLYAGCGYGGSCFPKDVRALIKTAHDNDCSALILEQVEAVNARQKLILSSKVINRFGQDLTGRSFAVWGIAFKPETDDCREAPSLTIIEELIKHGAQVRSYDPKALDEARDMLAGIPELNDAGLQRIRYAKNKYDALDGVDAMILVTEWKEFRSPDFSEMKRRMKTPVIFDGRNQYKADSLKALGFEYYGIG